MKNSLFCWFNDQCFKQLIYLLSLSTTRPWTLIRQSFVCSPEVTLAWLHHILTWLHCFVSSSSTIKSQASSSDKEKHGNKEWLKFSARMGFWWPPRYKKCDNSGKFGEKSGKLLEALKTLNNHFWTPQNFLEPQKNSTETDQLASFGIFKGIQDLYVFMYFRGQPPISVTGHWRILS